ncbi:CNH domain-containing protein [Mycena floridula]|nr:CNH domain-containing protein [Mycena floridula]
MLSIPRSPTPIDRDLQDLYNEVWAGFNAEDPPNSAASAERELDNIYSTYGGSDSAASSDYSSSTLTTPVTPASARYMPAKSPSGSGRVRRLPPTPSSSSFTMPEPEPYAFSENDQVPQYEPRPSPVRHQSSASEPRPLHESPSNPDLLRRVTAGSSRRLPQPPNGVSPDRPRPRDSSPFGSGFSPAPSGRSSPYPQQTSHHRRPSSPTPEYFDDRESRYLSPSAYNGSSSSEFLPPQNGSVYQNGSVAQYSSSSFVHPAPPIPYNATAGPSTPHVVRRNDSVDSYASSYGDFDDFGVVVDVNHGNVVRRASEMLRDLASTSHHGAEHIGFEGDFSWEDVQEIGEDSFVNFSLLSHLAVQLRDKVPRGTHVKGSIPYPRAFTGKDIVSTMQLQVQRELMINHGLSPHDPSMNDRRAALQVARSLQGQLFFYEVEWGSRALQDGVEDVYMFLDDAEGSIQEELPTGVVTMLTKCYVPSCGADENPCYSFTCPRRGHSFLEHSGAQEPPVPPKREAWINTVPKEVLDRLPESEINRQTIIHKIISKEDQYIQDLNTIETVFINPLRTANPPIISPPEVLEAFIEEVFGNILDLRECNCRLLEVMHVRQREMSFVIQRIGDVFLAAAADFRFAYPVYIGHHPLAEKRLKEEMEGNSEFRLFLEHCSRQSPRQGESFRLDLKHFLNRPSEHLQKYPVLLEAILHETADGNPDAGYLEEAIDAIQNLQTVAQLRTFQSAMGRGAAGKWEWHDLVPTDVRKGMSKEEAKRQSIIFELIKGEMAYVKDLENIETMYIVPLRAADPPIIPTERLDEFIKDTFHNIGELYSHHLNLVEIFHEIQLEQHPQIRSITAAMCDAALNFRGAYMEYIPNYPIATYRIDDEMANNPAFKAFVEECVRHPDAHRLDMKNFINRPIPRLLRYELLLKGILDESPMGHEDRREIPQVLEVIKSLGKDTEPGVVTAKQKVELWRYNANLVFKAGEAVDMDLLNEHRSLIHSGKLLRQPESGLEWNGWSELYVLLFDNYMVMTKPKEKDGLTKYHVVKRPIPLDLLTPVSFADPPTQRGTGILRTLRKGTEGEVLNVTANGTATESAADSRAVYPLTLHHNGRMGGPSILFAESAASRSGWKQKLEEALGIRKVVQESNKVFEMETLSSDTFMVPSLLSGPASPPSWNQDNSFTGKVTCSVPFNTADGRGLVAVGCGEGVWIGFRHDPKSLRRVLHLKLVTQCAMLEEFGIFLVLADKSLFAYHIEALVPSSPNNAHASQVPQKLNGTKDVHFFSVGSLQGRTLIIYMKKKGLDSIFRVLEPVGDKINERARAPTGIGARIFRPTKSEWFRIFRDFFLPSESFDLIFLKAKIAILCTKGFEIMDLNDFKSVTIPATDDARHAPLLKRCESCRPMGMFRSTDDEFLLVYDEFGVYVDKHGNPRRAAGTIEWEGTVERVALHMPYVLLFDPRFIEIRHLETGRLAQIIPGNDVRCLWDGRGLGSNSAVTPGGFDGRDDTMVQEAQVHAVMCMPDPTSRSRSTAQHVFELIPTVPLYLPGSVSPMHLELGYSQSYSPPHSPRESSIWRS